MPRMRGETPITARFKGETPIVARYRGETLVWRGVENLYISSGRALWLVAEDFTSISKVGAYPSSFIGTNQIRGMTTFKGRLLGAMGVSDDELVAIPPNNPAGISSLGGFPAGVSAPGALCEHEGNLLVVQSSTGSTIWQIDETNPSAGSRVYTSGLRFVSGMASFEGRLYICLGNRSVYWLVSGTSGQWALAGTVPGTSISQGLTVFDKKLVMLQRDASLYSVNVSSPPQSVRLGRPGVPADFGVSLSIAAH